MTFKKGISKFSPSFIIFSIADFCTTVKLNAFAFIGPEPFKAAMEYWKNAAHKDSRILDPAHHPVSHKFPNLFKNQIAYHLHLKEVTLSKVAL